MDLMRTRDFASDIIILDVLIWITVSRHLCRNLSDLLRKTGANGVVGVCGWNIILYETKKAGKSVNTTEATRMINRENAVILDIREQKKKFTQGILLGRTISRQERI